MLKSKKTSQNQLQLLNQQNLLHFNKQNQNQQQQSQQQAHQANITQQMKKFYNICLIVIVLDLILNYFWRQQLFNMGADLIIRMQRNYASNGLNIFFVMVTTLIDPAVVLMTAVVLMITIRNKFKGFVIIVYVLLNTYITGLLKAFYADPRPFWQFEQVHNIGFYCPQEYGNPSGHSWFSMIMGFGILVEHYGRGKYYWRIVVSACLCVFVPLSRMYLGAHSLNQVVQGLTMGCCMNILYIYDIRKQVRRFLVNFSDDRKTTHHHTKRLRADQKVKGQDFLHTYKWVILIVICHILYLSAYQFNSRFASKEISINWRENIIKKCGKLVDAQHLNFMMLIINSLIVNIATGIALGFRILLSSKHGKDYLSGKWQLNTKDRSCRSAYMLYLSFFFVQLFTLAVSFVIAGIILFLFGIKAKILIFIIANIAALLAGYLYTTQSSRLLYKHAIIRSVQQE